MLEAVRYLRESVSEYYFDLPRMAFVNFLWFLTALPAILVAFATVTAISIATGDMWTIILIQAIITTILSLALAGPGTAAAYHIANRTAHGELFEARLFWGAFRQYFWRGWRVALVNAGTGALLVVNIWFYTTIDRPGIWIVSIVFGYLLVIWLAIQSYIFALLVEFGHGVKLIVRNCLFLVLDRPGLTIGLLFCNLAVILVSIATGAALLPVATMTILAMLNNKALVNAIERYRAAGRVIPGDTG